MRPTNTVSSTSFYKTKLITVQVAYLFFLDFFINNCIPVVIFSHNSQNLKSTSSTTLSTYLKVKMLTIIAFHLHKTVNFRDITMSYCLYSLYSQLISNEGGTDFHLRHRTNTNVKFIALLRKVLLALRYSRSYHSKHHSSLNHHYGVILATEISLSGSEKDIT